MSNATIENTCVVTIKEEIISMLLRTDDAVVLAGTLKDLRAKLTKAESDEEILKRRIATKGSMDIWMADDFDAPLEEFEEYM